MDNGVYFQCPKCDCVLPQPMPATAACPACGIYFFKWVQHSSDLGQSREDEQHFVEERYGFSPWQPLEEIDSLSFYGRCGAFALLVLWSWFLIGYDYRYAEINTSFMHNILLPIHEAGHVLFIPLGEFMTILGGSLFQLMLPFGIGVAFWWKNHDNFGAAIGLWWCSASLIDLSPYIYDSLQPQMIMLGGHTGEDGPHDWIYLLNAVGQFSHAQGIGAFVHGCGAVLMVAALIWGAVVLSRQKALVQD